MENVAQLSEARGYSVHSKNVISARVSHLLLLSLPLAIIWVVAFFVINSPQGFSNWSFAHIFQEISERDFPTSAHLNTATAVMVVVFVSCVIAPSFHRAPRIVSFGLTSTVLWISLLMGAPTSFRITRGQRSLWDVYCIAAFTPTKDAPHWVSVGIFPVWSIGGYGKLAKHLSYDGYSLLHNSVRLICATFRDIRLSPGHFYFNNATVVCN